MGYHRPPEAYPLDKSHQRVSLPPKPTSDKMSRLSKLESTLLRVDPAESLRVPLLTLHAALLLALGVSACG